MIENILVVCTGNICRSPICEIILRSRFLNMSPQVTIHSAGLRALVDYPADPMAQELMKERGFDLSLHRARQLVAEIAFSADLILVMNREQQQQTEQQYPGTKGRVHRVGKWGRFDVPDPFLRPKIIFEQAFLLIEQGVNEWCQKLGYKNRASEV